MSGLFAELCDVIEPLCCLGPWYGVDPGLYGHNPDAPAIWSLTCHQCLHHGPPDVDDAGIWCEACGAVFWVDPQKSTGEVVPRRQVVQDATWARVLSRRYVIRDLEALKAAYAEAKARHREHIAELVRDVQEAQTQHPQHEEPGDVSGS
jgi:hypothetical protein